MFFVWKEGRSTIKDFEMPWEHYDNVCRALKHLKNRLEFRMIAEKSYLIRIPKEYFEDEIIKLLRIAQAQTKVSILIKTSTWKKDSLRKKRKRG